MLIQIFRFYFLLLRILFIQTRLPFSKLFINIMCFILYLLIMVPLSLFFSRRNIKNKITFQKINKTYNKNSFRNVTLPKSWTKG